MDWKRTLYGVRFLCKKKIQSSELWKLFNSKILVAMKFNVFLECFTAATAKLLYTLIFLIIF